MNNIAVLEGLWVLVYRLFKWHALCIIENMLITYIITRSLIQQLISVTRARELDLDFFKNIASGVDKFPEYGGYLVQTCRKYGHAIQAVTDIKYRPLCDQKPNDHTTITTSMFDAVQISQACGQNFTVYTSDLQLYRLLVDNIWVSPSEFPEFYPHLGIMHWLMSFVGCIGTLMADSGASDVLKSAFAGVEKMLAGKNIHKI